MAFLRMKFNIGIVFAIAVVLSACGAPDQSISTNNVAAEGDTGKILFVADHNVMQWQDGKIEQLTEGVYASSPTWAPAGDRFAYVQVGEAFSEIVVADATGEYLFTVTENDPGIAPFTEDYVYLAAWAWDPDWSPVSEEVVWVSDKGGLDTFSRFLYIWISETWEAPPYPLNATWELSNSQEGPAFSPDGQKLVFTVRVDHSDGARETELWTIDFDRRTTEHLISGGDGVYDGDWSPDGDHVVYIQRTGELNDVWITSLDGSDPYQLTQFGACAEPIWSPDGDSIVYIREVDGSFEVWQTELQRNSNGEITAGESSRLFREDNIDAQSGLTWVNPGS